MPARFRSRLRARYCLTPTLVTVCRSAVCWRPENAVIPYGVERRAKSGSGEAVNQDSLGRSPRNWSLTPHALKVRLSLHLNRRHIVHRKSHRNV
jgi:hypothetical protein